MRRRDEGRGRRRRPSASPPTRRTSPRRTSPPAALADLPFGIAGAPRPPVVADRAYDSDPLRDRLRRDGFTLVCPHRKNRVAPPTADGRHLRRYKRRYVVERTFAWLHSFRRVVTR